MKKAVIWDLDGTLLDSYDVIVESLDLTFQQVGIHLSKEEIHRHTILFSTKSIFQKVEALSGVPAAELKKQYSSISAGKCLEIKLMQGAKEILTTLAARKIENYVYTHRGTTTLPVLNHLQLTNYFQDIITSRNGFPRKPNPEGLMYLVNSYALDLQNTFYVGDRRLDMECAKNAGMNAILYLPQGSIDVSGGGEDYTVKELTEIEKLI